MTFHWPLILWCLAIPALLWIVAFLRSRRATIRNTPTKIIEAQASRNNLIVAHGGAPIRRRVRWRFYLGLAAAIVALARPQWGRIDEPIFDESRDILIALDLSRSMHAPDVRPSRLERAKLLIASLLDRLEGERVGLVVFAGTAFLQSPLSADYEILRDFLPSLDSDLLPQGGSNYRQLLDTSLEAFSPNSAADRYLIILSDGEATDDEWRASVDKLNKQNVRVIGLGVGTAEGSMIPDGSGGFVKDERGAVVLSRLETRTLQELAETTNGVYTDASTWVDLPRLIESTVETGRKELLAERRRVRLAERFQWALAPALLLLAWSFWREFPVRPRVRDLQLKTSTPPSLPRAAGRATPPPLPTAIPFLIIGLTLSFGPRASAQEQSAPPDTAAIAQPLSKLVALLSTRDSLTAANHAEIARTTITYGERLEAVQHPVPEGPVRDALLAVDAGQKRDPQAADWDELRARLEKFLEKPEDSPQEQPQEQEKQDQEKKDPQDKSDQPSSPQSGGESDQKRDQEKSEKQESSDQSSQPSQSSESGGQPQDQLQQQPSNSGSSAFGDMQEQTAPPDQPAPSSEPSESSGETQTVGTAAQQTAPIDPSLSIPLQKLEQVRNLDSPARLFQLMQDPNAKPEKPGKDW